MISEKELFRETITLCTFILTEVGNLYIVMDYCDGGRLIKPFEIFIRRSYVNLRLLIVV